MRYFWPLAAGVVALVIVGVVLGIVLTRGKPGIALKGPISWQDLPSLQTGKPPWPNNSTTLSLRLPSIGLKQLGSEGTTIHIHQHLDLYVDGKHVTVPQEIGFGLDSTGRPQYFTELHTHNALGILHVESPTDTKFKLGQFFGEWGVRLTARCLGSFKGSCDNLQWWVNGKKQIGDPAQLTLKQHQEIVIVVGKPPATIPKTYDFAAHGV